MESSQIFLIILLYIGGIGVFTAIFFIIRSFVRPMYRAQKAFDRVILQIMVPKEKRSDSSGQSNDERLEQIKEEIGITETLFATLAGLRPESGVGAWFQGRNDHFAFEMVVHDNLIYFYLAVPPKYQSFIEQQITAQYPYAQVEQIPDYNIFLPKSQIVGAYLVAKKSNILPFRTYKTMDSDPLAAILNILAKIHDHKSTAAIQYVIRPAKKTWRRKGIRVVRAVNKGDSFHHALKRNHVLKFFTMVASTLSEQFLGTKATEKTQHQISAMEQEMLKGIEEKLSKGGLEVTLRVISVSDDKEMAKLNLENILNAFSQYNFYQYGNEFSALLPRQQPTLIRDFIYRSFLEHRSFIVNTQEMTGFWHLPLHSTETPNIKWLSGRRAPPPSNLPETGLLLGHVMYRGSDTPIYMKEPDRRRHLYIIGKSGAGKSVLLGNLIRQDILNGKGVCVVDPHGDLIEDVLSIIPKNRADDVIIFDPSDAERPVGLNMLEAKTEDQKDFAVQEMISIFYKLFPPEMIGPMFEHNMRNVMLTLMGDITDTGTIIDIPRMFTDDAYVKKYLKKVKDPVVRAFWEKEMAKTSDFHKSEMLGYLISKVGRFVENEMIRNIMGQQKSGFDFR